MWWPNVFSSADFLHGPLAMVERHFPVILFAPPGVNAAGREESGSALGELGAETFGGYQRSGIGERLHPRDHHAERDR